MLDKLTQLQKELSDLSPHNANRLSNLISKVRDGGKISFAQDDDSLWERYTSQSPSHMALANWWKENAEKIPPDNKYDKSFRSWKEWYLDMQNEWGSNKGPEEVLEILKKQVSPGTLEDLLDYLPSQLRPPAPVTTEVPEDISSVTGVSTNNSGKENSKQIIVEEFLSAGLPLPIAQAAITNAKAESNFNPSAVGDGGKSVGLFQLHENGAGHGMSTEERKDPRKNTRRIIEIVKQVWNNKGKHNYTSGERAGQTIESLSEAVGRGASIGELAGLFSYHVERPADLVGSIEKRRNMARQIFGADADAPTG
jgi:uncharacterized protein (DUF2267 family)